MPFLNEAEMYDTALTHLPDYLGISESYAAITEFQVGYRRIDIVLLAIGGNYERYDLSALLRLRANDIWNVSVFLSLLDPHPSNPYGSNPAKTNYGSIEHQLNDLRNELGHSKFEDLIDNLQSIQEICIKPPIMVELKIRDWRNLILQSEYCKQNATVVCAILDSDFSEGIDSEAFSRGGIGLFFATYDSLKVQVPPEREKTSAMTPEVHFNYLRVLKSLLTPNSRWQFIK